MKPAPMIQLGHTLGFVPLSTGSISLPLGLGYSNLWVMLGKESSLAEILMVLLKTVDVMNKFSISATFSGQGCVQQTVAQGTTVDNQNNHFQGENKRNKL